jgi:hypothetical protein
MASNNVRTRLATLLTKIAEDLENSPKDKTPKHNHDLRPSINLPTARRLKSKMQKAFDSFVKAIDSSNSSTAAIKADELMQHLEEFLDYPADNVSSSNSSTNE